MQDVSIVFSIFLIFTGAALFSTIALWTRQSLLVAYIVLGALLGPYGFGFVADPEQIARIGDIGIIFLLFLLGLNLHPQNLWHMLRKVSWIALLSSIVFALCGFVVASIFGFSKVDSMVIAIAMMFSSTIIGLKLLPTTILHHQHTGEVMISVLLLQDIIAIIALLFLHGLANGHLSLHEGLIVVIGFPGITLVAFLLERFVLVPLLTRFDQVKEYVFLVAVGWCLGLAELAHFIGLSEEIGAFIAGVALAASPISLYISESLKPLRDFFLVVFFFSIGAYFNLASLKEIGIAALILSLLILVVKPIVFTWLLQRSGETKSVAREVGVRLGQGSEFSLLLAYLAMNGASLISQTASYLIQAATIITFIASSYIVVLKYPTPIAISERMRRD